MYGKLAYSSTGYAVKYFRKSFVHVFHLVLSADCIGYLVLKDRYRIK